MGGNWPSSFCMFMDRHEVKIHKHAYPAILTEQAWSIKDLLYGNNGGNNKFAEKSHTILSSQDRPILPLG